MCHSTQKGSDVNVQTYLGKKIDLPKKDCVPATFIVDSDPMNIRIPFENFVEDPSEKECFKVPKSIVFYLRGWGYTCFLNSFLICACAGEISRPSASKVI